MLVNHFIYASFPRVGYQTIRTPATNTLLTEKQQHLLSHPVGFLDGEVRIQHVFPSNGIVTLSCIYPTQDEYHRRTIWNHTFVLRREEYLQLQNPIALEPYFIRQTNYTKTLPQIEVTPNKPSDTQEYLGKEFGPKLPSILNAMQHSCVKIGLNGKANHLLYTAYALINESPNKQLAFATTDHALTPLEQIYSFKIYPAQTPHLLIHYLNGMEVPL